MNYTRIQQRIKKATEAAEEQFTRLATVNARQHSNGENKDEGANDIKDLWMAFSCQENPVINQLIPKIAKNVQHILGMVANANRKPNGFFELKICDDNDTMDRPKCEREKGNESM